MSETNGVHAALVKAQAEFGAISKDRTVTVQTRTGGSYKFAYAPLDSIMAKVRPVLAANDLAVTQTFSVAESGGPILTTSLIHADGSFISGNLPLPVHQGATAQEIGSLITYCRRYAIVCILGLATEEDDDANHATGNTVQAKQGDGQTPDPHGLQQSRGDTPTPGGVTDKQAALIRRLSKKLDLDVPAGLESLTKAEASARIEDLLQAEEAAKEDAGVESSDELDQLPF